MELRERAARIVAIARGEGRTREAALLAVLAELEALAPTEPDLSWRRQLGALQGLTRGQGLEQWNLEQTLRRVTELAVDTLGVARMSAWFFNADQSELTAADVFEASTRTHSSGATIDRADFPRYFALLSDARVIAVRDACHDPRSAEFAAIYFAGAGVSSTLDAPVRWQGVPTGVLCCEHSGELRTWRDDEVSFIASLADAVSLALEADRRRRAELDLAQKLALIEAQQQALQGLRSPVLELWDGVLAVPLGENLDPPRAATLLAALTAALGERRPAYVLLDLAAVPVIQPGTGEALAAMARAATAHGAQCVLSGLPGDAPQDSITGHPELRGLVTTSSLKTALQRCVKRPR